MDGLPGRGRTGRRRHAIVGLLAMTWLVVAVPGIRTSALRPAVVVPAAVLLPGYAVLSALVPVSDGDARFEEPVVRALFVAATGLSTVVLLGVALAFAPVGITVWTTLGGVTAVTLVGLVARDYRMGTGDRPAIVDASGPTDDASGPADTRRTDGRDADDRVTPSGSSGFATVSSVLAALVPSDPPVVRVVGAVVLIAGVLGLGTSAYLLAFHDQPGYAAFEASPVDGGPNGSALAGEPLEFSLENARSSAATYTVVASVERADDATGETVARRDVDSFTVELDAGESWTERHVPPTPWDGRTRAVYGLYRGGGATGQPDASVHRWLEQGDTGEGAGEP